MTQADTALHVPSLELTAAAERVQRIIDERERLRREYLAAEQLFIGEVAAVRAAGRMNARDVLAAYDQVREWGTTSCTSGFSTRWLQQIPLDRNSLSRLAAAIPPGNDATWSGDTGWDGLDGGDLPPRGTHVVYALFDHTGVPVWIGMTQQFRAKVKRHHRAGTTWVSWTAWPCADRDDALVVRRRIIEQYNLPNVAVSH